MNFEDAEAGDGVRFTWNVWPTSRLEQVKLVIPLGCMYTPLMNSETVYRCKYPPIHCKNDKCQSILNPWCDVDWVNKLWVCPLCLTRNTFPLNYSHISPENKPTELLDSSTTIEYEDLNEANQGSPTFLFVIDLQLPNNELEQIKISIQQILNLLPSDCLIGLITFGKHVSVHEIGFQQCSKCIVFRGDLTTDKQIKDFSIDRIKQLLASNNNGTNTMNPNTMNDNNNNNNNNNNNLNNPQNNTSNKPPSTTPKSSINASSQAQQSQSTLFRYLLPVSDILDTMTEVLDDLVRDPWPNQPASRPERCTGVAIKVAIALMELCIQSYNGRIILFSGGPPTVGPGKIVGLSLAEHLRGHRNIVKGQATFYEDACKYYQLLANRCASNGHVLDIFACSLDQLGIAEQRSLVDLTGGVLVLSDTFTTNVFQESFSGLFMSYMSNNNNNDNNNQENMDEMKEDDNEAILGMCFNGEIRVRCSRQIKVCGCIGSVSSMKELNHCVSDPNGNNSALGNNNDPNNNNLGLGGTSKWSIGGLFANTTLCFFFNIASNQSADDNNNQFSYIQFITNYNTSYNSIITRVTTVGIQLTNPVKKEGLDLIISSFDQETSAVILARIATYKADNEYNPDLMRWLDHQLIKLVSKFANYTKGDTDSFRLPTEFLLFPQFIYYLRRSQFIQLFNYSPDEISFFRTTLIRENVNNSLSMIQPLLHCYDLETENEESCYEVLLELSSRHPDRILLLDTFFHLVIWYGRNIAQWRNNKIWLTDPENYNWFKELITYPLNECNKRANVRFPYPNVIECDENSGQQRFLIAKLNPDNSQAQEEVNGDVCSDDVTLKVFMNHLKRLAVNPP